MRPNPYRVSGLILESSVPLPELTPADGEEPECRFGITAARAPGPAPLRWFHEWRLPDGRLWLGFARRRSGFLLRFPGLADFLVSADGKDIRCHARTAIPPETIRHLFLDQVLPLVLSQRGRLVLHASAIQAAGGAIAFLGVTGEGKSTLSATFWRQGFPLLTDDCLLLENAGGELMGTPSYPGLRLWPDVFDALFECEPARGPVAHYTAKRRLGLESVRLPFCSDSVPLRRLYILAPPSKPGHPNAVTITPLAPRDTFIELVKYAFCLDIADRGRLRSGFALLGRVASSRPVCRLAFSRDFSLLPVVREAILADLETRG